MSGDVVTPYSRKVDLVDVCADLMVDEADAVLDESDVRAVVRLLGDVIVARQDFASAKRQLMEGICAIIGADAWTWSLGCRAEPGEQPVYLGIAYGGFDEERYARLLLAAAHPDMAWTSEKLLGEMRQRNAHVTRLREHIVDEPAFVASGVDQHLRDADIGPFIFSLRPIDDRAVSTISLFRRRDVRPFSAREARITHVLLSELPWLHEVGWPLDRGVSVPRLSPRLRLVLNLLLDGRCRKEMASSLSLSEYTVAQYQRAVYRHFDVHSHATLLSRFRMGDGGDRQAAPAHLPGKGAA
ncbi:LuxR C-terminal-related transcriptional regulator [Xanthobacter sp. KR7-225]|uniref:helix-turn-helix transcriptional regulator n=1 Tax=Xanthobacter sp. KR7-225 TaxID=3156613 RepID=UPI0032B5737C